MAVDLAIGILTVLDHNQPTNQDNIMYKWIEASDYTKDCFKLPAIMEAKYDRHDMTILKGDDVFHPCHGGVVMAGVNTIDEAIQRLDDWYADLPASRK